MRKQLATLFLVGAVGLGCPGNNDSGGDAASGKLLFNQATLGTTTKGAGCVTCHSIKAGDNQALGPTLATVGNEASELREMITNPTAEYASGYEDNKTMPQNYSQVLTASEIDDLVAYLSTLK